MIESAIETMVCKKAEAAGWFVRKMAWQGRRGGPDRFFAKDGRVVLIEFKAPGKIAKAGQAKELERMLAAGVEVHQCDNPITALRILGIEYA